MTSGNCRRNGFTKSGCVACNAVEAVIVGFIFEKPVLKNSAQLFQVVNHIFRRADFLRQFKKRIGRKPDGGHLRLVGAQNIEGVFAFIDAVPDGDAVIFSSKLQFFRIRLIVF